jgi:hypothetical protein
MEYESSVLHSVTGFEYNNKVFEGEYGHVKDG